MTANDQAELDQWNLLLNNALADSHRRALLGIAVDNLNTATTERPDVHIDVANALSAILDRQPLNDQTWSAVEKSLSVCLGERPSRLIGWLVRDENYLSRLIEVRPDLQPPALALLQGLIARYGPGLERAFYMDGGYVDDWQRLQREIWTDPSTNRCKIRLSIMKYNGEDMLVEGGPDSMLTLATHVLMTLNGVQDASLFRQDPEPFLNEARRLVETLTPVPPEPTTQLAQSALDSRAATAGGPMRE